MSRKKKPFDGIYTAIEETKEGYAILYDRLGSPSVVFSIENPIQQMCADGERYEWFHTVLRNMVDVVGEGYAIQKQDVFCRQKFHHPVDAQAEFLTRSYFRYFEGREYTAIRTFIVLTQEPPRGRFVKYDAKKAIEFKDRVVKLANLLDERQVSHAVLNKAQINEYVHRFMAFMFRDGAISMQNISAGDDKLSFGRERVVKSFQLVDIDAMDLPATLSPTSVKIVNGYQLDTDLLSFLSELPYADCVVYNQIVQIPNQRQEQQRLGHKQKKHSSMPDPSQRVAEAEIASVLDYLSINSDLLVYANFNIIVSCPPDKLDKVTSALESRLYNIGIMPSKSAYNQLELFRASFPGNSYAFNKDYDLFLNLLNPMTAMFYKEQLKSSEDTPLKIFYTDRQGLPVCIDITGKEGRKRYTDNANFFCIGPSGSGKSFHMHVIWTKTHRKELQTKLIEAS